ncbi:TolC family protein [Chitinophaga filiformis]|uniref:Outer membrane protein TolC n=1 Tax=Chitinophaga filiformis TaxID=104663 RepID=A0A1G7Z9R4_CHIFI|nr:TolC family protein [Chitinophaga filiformis]SDH05276.1 Outer membrane protein TolC [Chitinophaga filiformis]
MSIVRYITPLLVSTALLASQYTTAQRVLTLEEARKLAVTRNNNLRAAEEKIGAAKAQKAIAGAKDKPTLDGSVTGFYFSSPLNKLLPEYGVSPMVTASQPLYSGGKIKLGKAAADKGLEIAEEQKALTTAEVILATESAYWQVVAAKEKIKLADQYAKQLDGLYRELNNAYTAGLTYKNDLLQVKVQQNDNQLNLIRTNDAWVLARLNLAQITGLGDSTDFVLPDSVLGEFNNGTLHRSMEEIAANRPEIKILQKSLESEKIQEKILKADFRPSVGLSAGGLAGFGKQGINLGNPSSNAFAAYYGMLQISMPILDWGQRKQKIKQQQHNITAQQYQLQETKEKISLEVQQAYLQLNESAKRIELSGASLEQAEENLRLSNDRLKAGTITGQDVLEAQTIWQQANSNIIDAKTAYRISEANLYKILGMTRF